MTVHSLRPLLLALAAVAATAPGLAAQRLTFRAEPIEASGRVAALVTPPDLLNREEVEESMKMLYPQELYRRGITVELVVMFAVDATGRIDPASIRVVRASHPWFRAAAPALVREFRLAPATIDVDGVRQPVPIRVIMPLSWTTGLQEL